MGLDFKHPDGKSYDRDRGRKVYDPTKCCLWLSRVSNVAKTIPNFQFILFMDSAVGRSSKVKLKPRYLLGYNREMFFDSSQVSAVVGKNRQTV